MVGDVSVTGAPSLVCNFLFHSSGRESLGVRADNVRQNGIDEELFDGISNFQELSTSGYALTGSA